MKLRHAATLSTSMMLCAALVSPATPAHTAPAKARVSIATSASTAKVGAKVTLKVTTQRAAKGSKTTLQRKASGRWKNVAHKRLNNAKRVSFHVTAARGTTSYRVKLQKTKKHRGATSRVVVVRGTVRAASNPTPNAVNLNAAQRQVLNDTNAFRARHGLKPLTPHPAMNAVAQTWTKKMASRGVLQHNPNYATDIPAGWRSAGENVAAGHPVLDVVAAWIQSPGHRANLLANFTHIGIGYATSNDAFGRYYTQVFARY